MSLPFPRNGIVRKVKCAYTKENVINHQAKWVNLIKITHTFALPNDFAMIEIDATDSSDVFNAVDATTATGFMDKYSNRNVNI